jgi:phage terminase large subunit-like protein
MDREGNFYVEDCVHGQWEPDERNQVMLATALRDRSRYGPSHEPRIYIEAEGGSSGRDAWKSVAKVLAGFPVYEERVTGKKDTRAEPWACQLASGNVHIVDNGESISAGRASWDIDGYIQEHLLFRPEPGKRLGRLKDQVDASSGAFNLLTGQKKVGSFQVVPFRKKAHKTVTVMVLSPEQLASTTIKDDPAILLCLKDPVPNQEDTTPEHGIHRLLGTHTSHFANVDPEKVQETWDAPLEGYGRPASEVMISRDDGKRIWCFLTRKYEPAPGIIVVCDEDQERALSVAYAVADGLNLSRKESIILPGSGDNGVVAEKGSPNQHLYQQVRNMKGVVLP